MSRIEVQAIGGMGNDLMVVNAARVSFSNWHDEFQPGDVRLIDYLARHNHWSPFAHPQAQFRVKAPIVVARQLVKHQVGLVWNEVSRRYVSARPEYYTPSSWRLKSTSAKQGSQDATLTGWRRWLAASAYQASLQVSDAVYALLLRLQVCPEQARFVLPQSMMTQWIWTGSLAAFHRVCRERLATDTQAETREVATPIAAQMQAQFPVSWAALNGGSKA